MLVYIKRKEKYIKVITIYHLNSVERRDIHLGIDIFVDQNTIVRSPSNGKVKILHNNDFKYDYGPTVILEHKINNYIFYTLYGHLSEKCLKKLKVGQSIKKGDWIGEIGDYKVNGNWPPIYIFNYDYTLDEVIIFLGLEKNIYSKFGSKFHLDPNIILKIPETFFTNKFQIKIFI